MDSLQNIPEQVNEDQLAYAIYLYFKEKFKKVIYEGFISAQELAEKIRAGEIDKEGQDNLSLRYKALIKLQKLPLAERNDALLESLVGRSQISIDDLVDKILPKFEIIILSKNGTKEEANNCFIEAIISVCEMAIRGKLNITKTIEDYVLITARNNWYTYLKEKNNYKRGKVSCNENSEYEENYINPFVSNKNEMLKDDENDMNDKITNISITSINSDIDIIQEQVFGNNDSENDSSDSIDDDILDDNKLNDELSKNIDPIMDDLFQNLYKQVEKILDAGYPKCKRLFEEYYFYDRSFEEIAVILNYANKHSVSTNLKSCHYRVKNRLRKMRISLY